MNGSTGRRRGRDRVFCGRSPWITMASWICSYSGRGLQWARLRPPWPWRRDRRGSSHRGGCAVDSPILILRACSWTARRVATRVATGRNFWRSCWKSWDLVRWRDCQRSAAQGRATLREAVLFRQMSFAIRPWCKGSRRRFVGRSSLLPTQRCHGPCCSPHTAGLTQCSSPWDCLAVVGRPKEGISRWLWMSVIPSLDPPSLWPQRMVQSVV
mmetsp:Transcript_11026/g.23572  ORF Transcript_11026/g.23572 Transcript_11026/m.23572 type:complete len:212 (+) Transcript_11026:58-693(+)